MTGKGKKKGGKFRPMDIEPEATASGSHQQQGGNKGKAKGDKQQRQQQPTSEPTGPDTGASPMQELAKLLGTSQPTPQQPQQQQQPQQPQQQQQQKQSQQQQHQQQPQQQKKKWQDKKDQARQKQQPQQQQQQQQQYQQQQQQHHRQNQKQQYQQKQQHPQEQFSRRPSSGSSHEPSPTPSVASSDAKSSPSHSAGLERIEEDLRGMKLDKQKIRSSNLLPVLKRANAFGKMGTAIKMEVNYVALLIDKLVGKAYHYDVDIQPPASRKWQRAAFEAFAAQALPGFLFAFDGHKNAYSARRVPSDHYKEEVKVSADGRNRSFTVGLKEAAVVDLSSLRNYLADTDLEKPLAAIQCLDVVLRTAYEKNNNFVKFKRSVYMIPSKPEDVGSNHELWYGLFQSAILGSKPYLNIDISHKAFPSGGEVLDILSSMNRGQIPQECNTWLLQDVHSYLKGMEVLYRGPDGVAKLFKYNGLKGPANVQKFKDQDGREMTISQYFQQRGRNLRYPHLPVMHVGSSIKNVMLPMELCSVPRGQALSKKHPDQCTQYIIKKSATDTATRKNKIMDIFSKIEYNKSGAIKEFGLGVGNGFETIDGRIIGAPNLLYANNKVVKPMLQRGVWRADYENFIVPSTVVTKTELSWVILNLDQRTTPNNVGEFGVEIYKTSKKQGVSMTQFDMKTHYKEPKQDRRFWTKDRELDQTLGDLKKYNYHLVFVIVPDSSGREDVYAKVKQKCELHLGILTQCIKGGTIFRKRTDQSTINNIWLKINAKTNGSNHVLVPGCKPPLIRQKVIYIGADVTHPSPDQTNIPSVVGVAASYDLEGFRYNFCYRLQGPREEMICDLENIVEKQLRHFGKHNNALPDLLMYYRDGVSDGQFSEVLTIELRAIQSAAAKIKPNYKPKITFIVVQKRHHTRFFPINNSPTEGRNRNLPPGTIVDKNITAPNQYQFFLISHAAVQGVAKPTKYAVLYDDANCDPDNLQATTYYLCHMFARCNRSVSYPAPTYYAHLAAYRGRVYIKDRNLNMNNLAMEYSKMQLRTEIIDGHPMFFV